MIFFVLLIIAFILSAITGIEAWIFFVGAIVLGIVYVVLDDKKEKELKQKDIDEKEKLRPEYEEYERKYNEVFAKYEKKGVVDEGLYHLLIDKNKLYLLGHKNSLDFYHIRKYSQKIPQTIQEDIYDIEEVRHYQITGSQRSEQYITGGGGGGSSLKGAVIGGVIAGDAGAIIGSRKKVDEVKTTYKNVDDRAIKITFENDTTTYVSFNCYEYLLDHIPEKEYENYIENKKKNGKK